MRFLQWFFGEKSESELEAKVRIQCLRFDTLDFKVNNLIAHEIERQPRAQKQHDKLNALAVCVDELIKREAALHRLLNFKTPKSWLRYPRCTDYSIAIGNIVVTTSESPKSTFDTKTTIKPLAKK